MSDEEDSTPGWKTGVGVVALAFAVVGGGFAYERCQDQAHGDSGRARLSRAHLVEVAAGKPALVLVEAVVHEEREYSTPSETRLDVLDTGGHLLKRLPRAPIDDCLPATPGLLWCQKGGALELRALPTLEVVASAADLARGVPALAKGLADGPVIGRDGLATFVTNDGRSWSLDPRTRVGSELPPSTSRVKRMPQALFGAGANPTTGSFALKGDREVAFESGGARRALVLRTKDGAPRSLAMGVTFLGASLVSLDELADELEEHRERPPLDIDVVFVRHADTLDTSKAKTSITAVALDGTPARWMVDLGRCELVRAWRFDNSLVLATQTKEGGAVVGVDVATGKVTWRHET